ncbi:ATP phosphoribosyltransferase regulatory subunit [Sphingomonas laterariae]|uniref:Histidine--tRNA ligase n=1 Tax=Edaphosphingomonas laterariae TaxID=861865 RepID=A0A239DDL3_9SPHN|nr:ATP phosphoribosyltransferase regulatory subunit [Sphingomonas laterariae]SNS30439.1 ATP phosphoribosyltransferase regulatory subunit [Sphingomonas laterariae]
MTTTPGLLPVGLRDRLPPQAEAASRLLHRVIVAIGRNGYERVAPPLAEFEDELVGRLKSARAHDLLRVVDPISQKTLALRPDITAQAGRIAATRMAHRPRPLRLAYGGPVLKLKTTQLRPERELTQAGAELIGSDSVAAAIEVLGVAIEALETAGVTGITVDLTLPDLIETLAAGPMPLTAARLERVRERLDAKDVGALAGLEAQAYLPLVAAAGPVAPAIAKLRALDGIAVLCQRLDAVEQIVAAFAGRATITLDPTERQGFEYQSWIGFSLFGEGLSGEIGRGGSYTILHADGREEPATGFSLYIDPLVDAGLGQEPSRRVFVPLGSDPAAAAALRGEGWTTIAALSETDDPAQANCAYILTGTTPEPLQPSP